MDNHALWKSNKKGVEKLDGGEQDVKGLVALAGELGPPEGAHCEGRPTKEVNKMAELFLGQRELHMYKDILSFPREKLT